MNDREMIKEILTKHKGFIAADRHDLNASHKLLIDNMDILAKSGIKHIGVETFNEIDRKVIEELQKYQATPPGTRITFNVGESSIDFIHFLFDNSHTIFFETRVEKRPFNTFSIQEIQDTLKKNSRIASLHTLIEAAHKMGIKIF